MTPFSDEEIAALKQSRYIENILPEDIIYGEVFDQEYHRLRTEGKEPVEIFETLGLNVDIIGKKRIAEYHTIYEERLDSNFDFDKDTEDTTISEGLKRLDREMDRLEQDKRHQ